MEKKITKAEQFRNILNALHEADIDEFDEFINHELDLLSRKKSSTKQTKEQKHTEALMLVIRDVLDHPMRVGEIADLDEVRACVDEDGASPSPNKISSTLRKMIAEGEVVRTEEKKIAYFALAE